MEKTITRFLKLYLASFCFLLIATNVFAQKTGFSGTWVINEDKSEFAGQPLNVMFRKLKVQQKKDSLIIEGFRFSENSVSNSTVTSYPFNGDNVTTILANKRKMTAFIHWSDDGKILTRYSSYSFHDKPVEVDYKSKESWSLTDNGKMLTVNRIFTLNNGSNYTIKAVYEKDTQESLNQVTVIGQGVQFEQNLSWQQILDKAKRENKYIFVDCFATWCVPCKKMDQEIYPSEKVGKYMNDKFISVKLQMDTSKNDNDSIRSRYATAHDFQEQYHVNVYPTYLFFSPDGKIVHRGAEYRDKFFFIAIANSALDSNMQFYTALTNYRQGRKNYLQMGYLIKNLGYLGEKDMAKKVAEDYKTNYLDKLNDSALLRKEYFEFLNLYPLLSNSKDGFFRLSYYHRDLVDSIMNYKDWAGSHVSYIVSKEEIYDKILIDNKPILIAPNWNKLTMAIRNKYNVNADKLIIDAQIYYYQRKKDWVNSIKYLSKKIDKYGLETLGLGADNQIMGIIGMHSNNREILNKAIGWMESLIEKDKPEYRAGLYGNYAGLLYKAGRTKEAISWLEKKIKIDEEVAAAQNYDIRKDASYNDKKMVLERMKRGDKIDDSWKASWFF